MVNKQPFAWWGGKQNLVHEILPLIPPHQQYLECFTGGGTVFWNKPPSKNEVINDKDGNVTNFYWQLKTNFTELQKLIQGTLHSEIHYLKSKEVLKDENADPLMRAWAFWCQCELTFSHMNFGGFAFGTTGSGLNTANKRDNFTERFEKRMRKCEIFNRDAVELLNTKSHEQTWAYVDPPYVSSDQGNYSGYTVDHFRDLLEALKDFKGKFLLSSYPEDILMEYREKYGWNTKDIKQTLLVSGKREERKYKTECLTWNYPTPSHQNSLFDFKEEVLIEKEEESKEGGE